MASLTISLPDETLRFAEEQASRGGHASVDAYLGALLHEARLRAARERLDALLLEALDSGPGEPVTPEFWEGIRREGLARGILRCPAGNRGGHQKSVYSTPRSAQNHADQIRRFVDRCDHGPPPEEGP